MSGVATYLLSSGRVSTQNIDDQLRRLGFTGTIEHEPLRVRYEPRRTLHAPEECRALLRTDRKLNAKIREVDALISEGKRYLSVGWPATTWADFLAERWGERVSFVGLVRQPYPFAASLLTHGFFSTRRDFYQTAGMIHGGDPNTRYPEIGARYKAFSPFEKALYHWLEFNRYILDFCNAGGWPVFLFERLYSGDETVIAEFYQALTGAPFTPDEKRFDKHQKALPIGLSLSDEGLIAACEALAIEAGYDADEIRAATKSVSTLEQVYAKRRL